MNIMNVVDSLVCTQRHQGLGHYSLRILKDRSGKYQVAVDTCGCRPGNWVFVIEGSAARYACGDPSVLTDLTVGGIIDKWEVDGEMQGVATQ
ncbi:MAG: carboxysome peptide B [Pseudomonadota bacterium]